eukprot:593429-Rhodomonas_salina.3
MAQYHAFSCYDYRTSHRDSVGDRGRTSLRAGPTARSRYKRSTSWYLDVVPHAVSVPDIACRQHARRPVAAHTTDRSRPPTAQPPGREPASTWCAQKSVDRRNGEEEDEDEEEEEEDEEEEEEDGGGGGDDDGDDDDDEDEDEDDDDDDVMMMMMTVKVKVIMNPPMKDVAPERHQETAIM